MEKIATGLVHVLPPSNDLSRSCAPIPGVPEAICVTARYATPLLSVRMVHPVR